MASISLTMPTSPNTLGLRFRLRCLDPNHVFLRFRFRSPDCRRSLLVCYSELASSGEDRGGRGQSWTSFSSSPDSFSGWSSENAGGGSPNEERFSGILGAGLAGLLFTSGVAFAAISLSGRSANGVKRQMKPLTGEQAALLSSDDLRAEVDQGGIDSNVVSSGKEMKIHDQNSDPEKGLDQDEVQTAADVDSSPVPAGCNPVSSDLIVDDEPDFSSEVSSIKDSQSSISRITNSANDPYENQDCHTPDESSFLADPPIDVAGQQDGNFSPAETINDMGPLGYSNELDSQLAGELLMPDDIKLESTDVLDFAVRPGKEVGSVEFSIEENNIDQSQELQLPSSDAGISVSLGHDIDETDPSVTMSRSDLDQIEALPPLNQSMIAEALRVNETMSKAEVADPVGNESDVDNHIPINKSSLLNPIIPEKSFSSAGIPAPSLLSAALQVPPGKVLVPAVVDQVQGDALAALQVLKVIEANVQPGDLCTRREYACWLVASSGALSRNTISKVYPAMYIENVTELAFDDITPEDPDFACIQGLAEAGLVSSKLSMSDGLFSKQDGPILFYPDKLLSRQDLVSWKMALEKRQLPEVDRECLYKCSGYIDIEKIHPEAWPALVADLSTGEQGIIALAFGYTRLFQPQKPVTKAQAAIALATGDAAEVVGEELARIEAESLAETAVDAHNALVAQVEKDLNSSYEKELTKEREKIDALEKLAEEARVELERLKAEREEENDSVIRGRAAVESEIEVLSKLRHEVEEQLQSLMGDKMEISFEKDRINRLREEAEKENQIIVQLQYELEVERKALSMARAWAEEEAKRAREHARALELARDRWERHGIKVVVAEDLQDDVSAGITWATAVEQAPLNETISTGENLVEKLKAMAGEVKIRSSVVINSIIQKILSLISDLKQRVTDASEHLREQYMIMSFKARESAQGIQEKASSFGSGVRDRTKRVYEDCKENVERITQKLKTQQRHS